jgi:predicted dehydrogenase
MRILIIGLGSIGKKHVIAIKSILPDSEIFALRSFRDAEKHPEVTNIYNLDEIETSLIDFAIIANPTSEHKRTIAQLVKFGFPLFIEKPICTTLDIEDLVNSINNRRINTYVACNLRFWGCIRFLKDMLPQMPEKKINEINVYCGSYLPEWRPNVDFRTNYSAISEFGGGAHFDLIHELDYLYWLFGAPKEVKRNLRSQSSLSISSIDYANYLLYYNGFCASVVLNYYRRDPKRSFEIVFEDETWNIDLLKNQITCNNQTIFSSGQQMADTYQTQMEYFINCINEKANTFNTISDAFNVLKICIDYDIK